MNVSIVRIQMARIQSPSLTVMWITPTIDVTSKWLRAAVFPYVLMSEHTIQHAAIFIANIRNFIFIFFSHFNSWFILYLFGHIFLAITIYDGKNENHFTFCCAEYYYFIFFFLFISYE